jgi:hypothetical protein
MIFDCFLSAWFGRFLRWIFLVSLFTGFPFPTDIFAQYEEPWHLPRAEEPIVLDGMPDEAAWEQVEPVPVVQYEPDAGEPATEETEFLFTYDDEYFYAAIRAYDDTPEGIRSNTLYRDALSGDDHFEFMLDTYNDDETGVIFTTTPAGIRREAAVSNDASGGGISSGSWLNVDYNTYWAVETVVNDRGWFAEMRIPFSSLRFQERNGQVTMGLIVQRKIARRGERVVFPAIEPDADLAFLKPSRAHHIVLEGVESRRPLHVTPYALGGFETVSALNEDQTGYVMQDDFQRDAGLDVKYRVTPNLSMDLTLNTDFAQVEADNEQINLSRFSLFFPEKRRFFQERSGLFEFRTGGDSRLFHSRRIGITRDGRPVRILGGARLVGRMNDWDIGAMEMQTEATGSLPSENFGVLRMRRKVLNPYSYAGGLVTSRLGMDGTYNVTYGLDGLFRVTGDDYLSVKWAQTIDDQVVRNGTLTPINSGRIALEFQRRRRRGLGFNLFMTRSGPFYDPGMGFTRRQDFLNLDNTVSYTWMPGRDSPLIWHTLELNGYGFLRNEDGTIESAALVPAWDFTAKSQARGGARLKLQYEDLLVPFALSESTQIPAGSYAFTTVQADYQTPYTDLVDTGVEVEGGTFYDGWQFSTRLTPTWSISKHLELEGTYEYHRIRFPDRGQRYDTHLGRVRLRAALNTQLSLNTFVQYNGTAERFSANTRFRYNFREGNDLWIVYNEALRTDRRTALPSGLPLTDTRTVLAKYTYTLHF